MSRPFADVLRELSGGQTIVECGDRLAELVEAVAETGKAGSLTLKINVKPNGKDGNAVEVSDSVTLKKPEPERGKSFFFTDAGGSLVRNDPRQDDLPLREVRHND